MSSSYAHKKMSVSSCYENLDDTSREFALGCVTHIPVTLKHVGLSPDTIWANENVIFALEGEKGFDQRSDTMYWILTLLHYCHPALEQDELLQIKDKLNFRPLEVENCF